MLYFGVTQHLGLAEDVLDHRLNSRTVYMNPIFRFLYWNMNYHVEHHMFPLIPYHALPKLHEEIKARLPDALSEHDRRLSRDHPGAGPAAEGSDLFRAARAAGRRAGPPPVGAAAGAESAELEDRSA